jgi:ABC-type transporter Mla maintaining outer membrane lipid asymmetry ATPase subunit MlaF
MIDVRNLALDGRLPPPGLDLTLARGGNLLVTGPSGSGKSLLLRVLAGTERPARGRVQVGGRDLWPGGVLALSRRVRLGFSFATGGLLSNLSLQENLALPLRFLGLPGAERERRVGEALERLDLAAVAGLRPHAVNASARKQANLARVLALEPELVLLDDPLEGLDAADRARAEELIQVWATDVSCTLVIAVEGADSFSQLEAARLQLDQTPMPAELP